MNKIIEKAQELGMLIAESEIKKAATSATDAINNDETAVKLMATYNEIRNRQIEKFKGKNPSPEEIKDFQDLMQKEFEKIMKNDKIATYVAANKSLDSLMEQVNAILAYYISGGEENKGGCDCGCSGSCSDCGGCH